MEEGLMSDERDATIERLQIMIERLQATIERLQKEKSHTAISPSSPPAREFDRHADDINDPDARRRLYILLDSMVPPDPKSPGSSGDAKSSRGT
jgi:hypothetical protein